MTTGKLYRFNVHIATGRPNRRKDAGEVMEPDARLVFVIDYPLERPAACESTKPGGNWTVAEFIRAVQDHYRHVYAEEAATMTQDPTPRGLVLNRRASKGVHGIDLHDLGDLFLEGAQRGHDGVWRLLVGS